MRIKHLPIADPCHEDWDAMDRVERGRFCQSCVKQVYDLSSMTEPQARTVLRDNAGSRICVRYCHDAEGQIRFRPPAVASTTCGSPRRMAWAGAMVMAVAMAACTPHQRPDDAPRAKPETAATETQVLGRLPVRESPEPEIQQAKGEIVAIDPEPKPEPKPEPEPEYELLGDVAAEPLPPPPPVEPVHAVKGDVAMPTPEFMAESAEQRIGQTPAIGGHDEPCDGVRSR